MQNIFHRRWPKPVLGTSSATRALLVGVAAVPFLLTACSGGNKNNQVATQAATVAAPPSVVAPPSVAAPASRTAAASAVASAASAAPATTAAATAVQASPSTASAASTKVPLLSVILNAPTPVPPTPRPAGVTPTPPPPPATPAPAQTKEIIFYVDTVTSSAGESPLHVDADRYCTQSSAFRRGMHVVFRVTAFDNTGKELQPADMQSAVLKVPGNDDLKLNYGQHAPGIWFWTVAWNVPLDYPLGVVDFSVVFATNSGKTGTFKQLQIGGNPGSPLVESRLSVVG
jgi:hypothetical protein